MDFPFDSGAAPEPPDKRKLQRAYRKELLSDLSQMRYDVASHADMEQHLARLKIRLDQLELQGDRLRKFTLTTFVGILSTLLLLCARLWWGIQSMLNSAAETEKSVTGTADTVGQAADQVASTAADVAQTAEQVAGTAEVFSKTADLVAGGTTQIHTSARGAVC